MGCVGCARLARVCVWRRLGAVRARACVLFHENTPKKHRKVENGSYGLEFLFYGLEFLTLGIYTDMPSKPRRAAASILFFPNSPYRNSGTRGSGIRGAEIARFLCKSRGCLDRTRRYSSRSRGISEWNPSRPVRKLSRPARKLSRPARKLSRPARKLSRPARKLSRASARETQQASARGGSACDQQPAANCN